MTASPMEIVAARVDGRADAVRGFTVRDHVNHLPGNLRAVPGLASTSTTAWARQLETCQLSCTVRPGLA